MAVPSTKNEVGSRNWLPCDDSLADTVPGYPHISLKDRVRLTDFLWGEFCSDDVDRMAPHLWMMSQQSSANISPLHRQRVKRREIVVTEDPKLHLVWMYDRIFIKPLPKYLLSDNFTRKYLLSSSSLPSPLLLRPNQKTEIRAATLGYLRTYSLLIRYESDLRIAQDKNLCLVPREMCWPQFCNFTRQYLPTTSDADVSERYRFGEIRLTRLNFYSKFFLRKSAYQRMYSSYGAYFSRFYGPLIFIFGSLSTQLSTMQVLVGSQSQMSSAESRPLPI